MADLHFELVTPEKLVMSDDVHMVVVPGTEGQFGVMAGHAPYMSTLRDGELAVYRPAAGVPGPFPVGRCLRHGRRSRGADPRQRRLCRGQRQGAYRARGERGGLTGTKRQRCVLLQSAS